MKTSFAIATILLEVGRTAAEPAFTPLPAACENLFGCLTKVPNCYLPVIDDIFAGLESTTADDVCNYILSIFGDETGTNAICGAVDPYDGLPWIPDNGQIQAATCTSGIPQDPVYPFGPDYVLLTDPVLTPFLVGGREERADTNAYSGLFIGTIFARMAQALVIACPLDSDVCKALKTVAAGLVVFLEATVETLNIQDGFIDSAEIEATYLNTNTIISQNCVIGGDIANLQADSDLDSLMLSIEPTDDSKTVFLVLSTERGVETAIDLVIDRYDETEEGYLPQLFTSTEIVEGTTLVKFPKSEKNSKSMKSGKGNSGEIRRFKGTAKKESRSGVFSTRTVLQK